MATKKTAAAPKAAEKKTTTKAAAPKAPKADVSVKAAEKVVAKAEVPAAAAKAEVSVVAAAPAAPAAPAAVSPSREAIGKRAFELFVARGGANGNAFEDWVRAERELMGASAN
jgi:hypothetical protein